MYEMIKSSQGTISYSISSSDYRQYSRFTNNLGTLVEINLHLDPTVFSNWIKGLIINDSLGGCGLILTTKEVVHPNQICSIRIKGLNPIKIRIVWVKELDTNIYRLGLEYLAD
ncbi:hypothetical protein PCC7424_4666 [Gloeothece citriformis PCC 7424]|uniref:PilZ domain-containing protein n=1 Tax=Gloeothece citriformis (strain PCC 7424) TaxID=65393 RepID=B7KBP9_GLOC7|nr:PilZ domain-containing protein [Gloeothece citriformis]ACK73027.1 hypothetical protein PCC7424_4666 [Gloeothece citriformis PCC 7424]